MFRAICLTLLLQLAICCLDNYEQTSFSEWKQGKNYKVSFQLKTKFVGSLKNWRLKMKFTQKLKKNIEAYQVSVPKRTKGKNGAVMTSKRWNSVLKSGESMSFIFTFKHKTNGNFLQCLEFCGILLKTGNQICVKSSAQHPTKHHGHTKKPKHHGHTTKKPKYYKHTTKQPKISHKKYGQLTTIAQKTRSCLNNYFHEYHSEWKYHGGWRISAAIEPSFKYNLENWQLHMEFNEPLYKDMTAWVVNGLRRTKGKTKITLRALHYNKVLKPNSFKLSYFVDFKTFQNKNYLKCVEFCGYKQGTNEEICASTVLTTTTPPTTPITTSTTPTTNPTTTITSTEKTTPTTTTTTSTTTTTTPITTTTTTTTPTTTPTTITTSTETTTPTTTTTTSTTTSKTSPTTLTTETKTTTTKDPSQCKYNYAEVLEKSLLFYEAQRSGRLPPNQRVKWRKNSALNDGSVEGLDLTGGYFDAGDYIKFGFPMAATITNLAWGMIEFKEGYKAAKQFDYGLDAIKWGTDYFLKCHAGTNRFIGQIGDGDIDHGYWERPEDMNMLRPVYEVNEKRPGSDLIGETVAALAASFILFRDKGNLMYALDLLSHAKQLYTFAMKHRGTYNTAIPDAVSYYKSKNGFLDELAWASLWMYRATGEDVYKNNFLTEFNNEALKQNPGEFTWDNKWYGVQVLAQELQITKKNYLNNFKQFIRKPLTTQKGLFYVSDSGPNRHAANLAFLASIASTLADKEFYHSFSQKQINYMLGDGGRSYVVGFGHNPPQRPHHRSSSCPSNGPCDWDNLGSPNPNPHILYGALVGGPDKNDSYTDIRADYKKNEVTCDYNAGFQSAVAALLQSSIKKC